MVPGFIKSAFVRALLGHLKDGDKGSTLLGIIAAALLAANLDFGKILAGLHDQDSAIECGKAAAIALLAIWGYFVGRKKATDPDPAKTSPAAPETPH